MYFVQELYHPYTTLQGLQESLFSDINIDLDAKLYAMQYMVLNALFDRPDVLQENLGLAYFAIKNYFQSKDDLLVIYDPDGLLLQEVIFFFKSNFNNFELRLPLYDSIPTDIIKSYDDFFDKQKVINTAIYMIRVYCLPDTESIVSFDDTLSFIGQEYA